MGKHDPILEQTFDINGKPHSVWLYEHQLKWCPKNSGGDDDMSDWMSVKITDIFSVEIEEGTPSSSNCCIPILSTPSLPPPPNLMVYYAQRRRNTDVWECEAVKLGQSDPEVLSQWSCVIQSAVAELKNRPKNLLVLLNPFGGKGQAQVTFEESVKPIFELAGVTWTLVNTQYPNHASETLISMAQDRLHEYDVVVAVGGDGTACEVVTGLLRRSAETSASNQDTILQPATLNMAIIPAGSSNALAYSVHGTDDPCTAAIHLILGGSVPLDVGAIHDNHSGVARFFVTQISYGHLADTLKKSDKLRWMGPRRYDYAGLCKFMGHKAYEGTLEMRLIGDDSRRPTSPSECGAGNGCSECSLRESMATKETAPSEWKKVDGRFLGISSANISCRTSLCPRGMAPFAHISDGHLDIVIVRKASRSNHLRYLLRTAGDSRRAFQLPFVERYHAKEFIFTPISCCPSTGIGNNSETGTLGSSSTVSICGCDAREAKKKHSFWNCDGELLRQSSVRVTVHTDLVRIMARAPMELECTPSTSTPSDVTPPSMDSLPIEIPIN